MDLLSHQKKISCGGPVCYLLIIRRPCKGVSSFMVENVIAFSKNQCGSLGDLRVENKEVPCHVVRHKCLVFLLDLHVYKEAT